MHSLLSFLLIARIDLATIPLVTVTLVTVTYRPCITFGLVSPALGAQCFLTHSTPQPNTLYANMITTMYPTYLPTSPVPYP